MQTDIKPTNVPAARIRRQDVGGSTAYEITSPSDQTLLGQIGWASPTHVKQAVEVASRAFPSWSEAPARDRAKALRRIAEDLRAEAETIAPILAAESGKRLAEASGEVEFSAKYFDWFAEAAAIADTEEAVLTSNRRFRVRKHPVGVVAALGTWNFPLSIPARKIAAAVAAGCPTILKPSERTPFSANTLIRICERHLPEGVIAMVIGDGEELSNALIDDGRVAAVSFTGSTPIGMLVAERCGRTMTRSVLELGGRAPFIVREDADLSKTVEHLLVAKFRNNGSSCIAANNVFVHASRYNEFRSALAEQIRKIRPGTPFDDQADIGPLIDENEVNRLNTLVSQAEQAGASVIRGHDGPKSGFYLPATLVENAQSTGLWSEEIFGPVLAMTAYEDEDSLVDEINSWGTGLAGYVCGADQAAAERLAEQLRIGIVGINNGAPNTPEVPFGGFGFSGIGREGGMPGYNEFTELQTISIAR